MIILPTVGLAFSFLFFNPNKIINIDIDLNFDENNAFSNIEDQLNINSTHYRIPGTQGREDCIDYFIDKFKEINENFSIILHNYTVLSVECQNIVFKLNEHLNNIVILAAHYDSRAKATKDPNLSLRSNPVPGANDGASGCGVLLELARVLYQVRSILNCQLWFLFFDAEDQGYEPGYDYGISDWNWCEGSTRFANSLENFHELDESFDCLLLLDMVGGVNLQFINEQYSTSSLLQEIFEVGRQLGFSEAFPTSPISNTILDDHVSFVEMGIPSADLIINFWNNPSWPYHHTTQDDISHISNHSLEITGKTVEQFVYNNYLLISNNNYVGNYPWREDINVLDTDILTILITFSSIIILLALCIAVYRKYFDKNITKVKDN